MLLFDVWCWVVVVVVCLLFVCGFVLWCVVVVSCPLSLFFARCSSCVRCWSLFVVVCCSSRCSSFVVARLVLSFVVVVCVWLFVVFCYLLLLVVFCV